MKGETAVKLNRKKRSRRASGISWRLFGTLVVFVVLILLAIWVLQIVMLNRFYEKSKLDEFAKSESNIYGHIEHERMMIDSVYRRSVDTDVCIIFYKIEDGAARERYGHSVCIAYSRQRKIHLPRHQSAVQNWL